MHEHDTQENRVLEKLGDLARQQRTMVEHVLACPGCKAGLLDELAEDEARLEEPDYGAVLRHLEGRSPGLLHLLSQREAQAGELFRRLMVLPAEEREERVRSGTVRSWPLVYRLLTESQRAQPQAPERSRELACLALAAVDAVKTPERMGAVQEVRARAHALEANARRLLGDWRGAERSFHTAARHLTSPPESSDRGFYCLLRALLCLDTDRLEEAVELLWRAVQIFGHSGEDGEQGLCLALLGFLHLGDGDAGRAQPLLTRACIALEPRAHAGLWVRARLALAVGHAEMGRCERALRLAERTRPHVQPMVSGVDEQLAVLWLECRLAKATEQRQRTAELLSRFDPEFLADGGLIKTAMASFDLARLAEARCEPVHLGRLVDEILTHLPHRARHLLVLAALHQRSIFRGHEGPEF